jgi:hypothetical protein
MPAPPDPSREPMSERALAEATRQLSLARNRLGRARRAHELANGRLYRARQAHADALAEITEANREVEALHDLVRRRMESVPDPTLPRTEALNMSEILERAVRQFNERCAGLNSVSLPGGRRFTTIERINVVRDAGADTPTPLTAGDPHALLETITTERVNRTDPGRQPAAPVSPISLWPTSIQGEWARARIRAESFDLPPDGIEPEDL